MVVGLLVSVVDCSFGLSVWVACFGHVCMHTCAQARTHITIVFVHIAALKPKFVILLVLWSVMAPRSKSSQTVNPRYKEDYYDLFSRNGRCRHGARCLFAHGPEEKRDPARRHKRARTGDATAANCKNIPLPKSMPPPPKSAIPPWQQEREKQKKKEPGNPPTQTHATHSPPTHVP